MDNHFILASSSPRRQSILRQVGISYSVQNPNVNESTIKTCDPVEKVTQLARLKNHALSLEDDRAIIISADTVVSFCGQILEKPRDKQDAFRMIHDMSHHSHEVYTGVHIRTKDQKKTFFEKTEVTFWPLTDETIETYVQTDEPYDKAGGYGIQSTGARFVKKINGDYYNVMGLPISRLIQELHSFGASIH